jgi:hypothetical protein
MTPVKQRNTPNEKYGTNYDAFRRFLVPKEHSPPIFKIKSYAVNLYIHKKVSTASQSQRDFFPTKGSIYPKFPKIFLSKIKNRVYFLLRVSALFSKIIQFCFILLQNETHPDNLIPARNECGGGSRATQRRII